MVALNAQTRYNPTMSWDMVGHEWAVDMLQQHIRRGEVRHAYLFAGPPAVGKRTLSLRFTQALNCLEPPAMGEFCGTCRICRQTSQMQHADLSIIQSEREGASLDVDTVRSLQYNLSLMPYEAKYRVALLLRMHEATESAQNALLKTLEEAPPRVILLLTATTAEDVLPTIASRCEVLRLRPMPVETLAENLMRDSQLPSNPARIIAHISGGRVGLAKLLASSPEYLQTRADELDQFFDLLQRPIRERFTFAQKLVSDTMTREKRDLCRAKLRSLLGTWQTVWRDVFLLASGSNAPLTNPDLEVSIRQLADLHTSADAIRQVDLIETALNRLPNANLRLLVEVLFIDQPRLTLPPVSPQLLVEDE